MARINGMSDLHLYLLGPPRLELHGDIVEPDTRKATALLAYVALTRERLSRDALAAFLWPELDDKRGKAALRRTLSSLKSAVGNAPLFATREQIGIEPGQIWCDVDAFAQAVANGTLETAAALYRDDFMLGFTLRDSIPFDDWQVQQSEYLRRELDGVLAQLVQQAIDRQDFAGGIDHAHRWLQLNPLREEAHCQLMRLYAWNGQRPAAIQQYRDCVRILDKELGVIPLPETTSLYHDIQNDKLTRWQVDETVSQPAGAASPLHRSLTSLPLVGRTAELAQMQTLYQQVAPHGRFLIIAGEPGIGKTRLAAALLHQAAGAGAATLTARCYEGETNLAYAPIIQLLQDGLAGDRASQIDALPVHHIAEAARLLPQLATGRTLPPLPNLEAPGAQVRFYEGIAQLLTALLAGPAPGILWLDDAHWLDAASQELLLYLLHRWRERPFLMLLCWRTADLSPDNPLPALAATLGHSNICATIRPPRFTAAEVSQLLDKSGLDYAPELPTHLYQETEGLPFFVVEYLRTLQTQDDAGGDALPTPPSVRDLLRQRLRQIDETERQIMQTAAAIGHSFDLMLMQAASGRALEETVTALEQLTRRGLLLEQTGSDRAAYDFSHDKLRVLVYEEMGLARRRLLHRRLAETLAQRRLAPTASDSAQIAAHYQQAGQEAEAAAYYVQAGDRARALYAHRDAIHHYRAALALGADEAWRLHAACGELFLRLGNYPQALASLDTAAALAPAPAALGRLEHKLAQVYLRQGEWALAAITLSRAQQRLAETADPATLAQILLDRSLVAQRQQQADVALAWAQQAHALADASGDPATLALVTNMLGLLARNRGELETAVSLLTQSCQLADENGRLDIQVAARNNLALTLDAAGQLTAARAQLEQALSACQRLGDRHYEAALRSNLADVLHQLGEEMAAQAQIKQSVTIYAEIGREEETWRAEIWQLTAW